LVRSGGRGHGDPGGDVGVHMPARLAGESFLYGVATGLMNIVWIVVAAVYLYDISVSTGTSRS